MKGGPGKAVRGYRQSSCDRMCRGFKFFAVKDADNFEGGYCFCSHSEKETKKYGSCDHNCNFVYERVMTKEQELKL